MQDIILTVLIILAYAAGVACAAMGYMAGKKLGEEVAYRSGMDFFCDEIREERRRCPPVAIGDEVYAVLRPFDECDPPAYIEAYRVYGVGVTKDGKPFIINEDMEHFMLDDEDEGLSFSTRARAEKFLKKYIKSK